MRIAQVAPLFESVPPKGYGGTERVVHHLTEELVRLGHQVTLFASGDSTTSAELVAPCHNSLRTDEQCIDPIAVHFLMLEEVVRRAASFDVIHFHVDYLSYPFARRRLGAHVTTLHGRLDLPQLPGLYREYANVPVISISNAQRKPLPSANWQGTVHHGFPEDLFTFRERPGNYLAFLGRLSPEKRVDRAIEIAERAGWPLKIMAKVDKSDQDYFEGTVKPLLQKPHVEFVGEVGGTEKDELLGNAAALLFPIDWPEPFGLVMIEAMACGVPTIAWPCGSVREVLEERVTGFIVETIEGAVEAVGRISAFDRCRCRSEFERRFSARRMAEDYLAIYRKLVLRAAGTSTLPHRRDGRARRPIDGPASRPALGAPLTASPLLPE